MKKRTLAFILFLAAVNFAGCVGQGAAVSDPLPRQQTSGAPAADHTEQLRFSRGTLTPGNEQGCYLVLPAPSGGASLLWYADYETQQLVELCTQPNCAHDNSSCTAWIPCPANIPRIAVAGEKLVLLFPGNPYFLDQYGEDALARIETRDLTGRFLKEVTRFTAGTALANEYAIGEHALYVFDADVAPETLQTIKTLIKVDLLSGKKETIASFQPENNEDYFGVGTTASEFIFKKISVRETAAETAEEMRLAQVHQLFTVSLQGERGPNFQEWAHLKGLEGFVDHKLFYITGGQLSPLLSDETTNQVPLIQNEIFDPNEVNFAAYSPPYLILSSSIYRDEDFDAPIFYSANTETGEVKELAAIKELGDNSNLSFYAQTDKALFVMYYDQKTDEETFALAGKEDLWESSSAWKKFTFS